MCLGEKRKIQEFEERKKKQSNKREHIKTTCFWHARKHQQQPTKLIMDLVHQREIYIVFSVKLQNESGKIC